MPFDQSEPTQADVERWFLANPDVPARTFELALVLGGTVSAGAYTAGALDFLVEALDCWEAARQGDVPQHRVVLRVITGTSGGGVNAAIAARALNFAFRPVPKDVPDGIDNPFYNTWVNELSLERFLGTRDRGGGFTSLLDGAAIDDGAGKIVRFAGTGPKARDWLGDPLHLIMTLTNLAGVPYEIKFARNRSEQYINHADYIRFAIQYDGRPPQPLRPDALPLRFGPDQDAAWDAFSLFARATAAFPGGFPPRSLERPAEHYRWRILPKTALDRETTSGDKRYFALLPDWDALLYSGAASADGKYFFLAVDGGATDNEPIELARTALCGILGVNPREADLANRAVVLIDPFAGKADLGPQQGGKFIDNLGSLLSTMIQQTRYDSRDLLLAADENVFSRFMLTPNKPRADGSEAIGAEAIASAGLGAFLGFACADFMRHDYMLGRKNCQEFLRCDFALGEANPVFADCWTENQKERLAKGTRSGFLPLVPLVGSAALPQEIEEWPRSKLDPSRFEGALRTRYRELLELEFGRATGLLGGWATQRYASRRMIKIISQALEKTGLR